MPNKVGQDSQLDSMLTQKELYITTYDLIIVKNSNTSKNKQVSLSKKLKVFFFVSHSTRNENPND